MKRFTLFPFRSKAGPDGHLVSSAKTLQAVSAGLGNGGGFENTRGGGRLSQGSQFDGYRGTSLIRNSPPLGPYRTTMPEILEGSQGGGSFL